ncbi:MAG: hypothetical protein HQM10_23635 [Candidatus Riflebacteria bacterium]|nr:hypothetical protein [Candidatus Riflebacteria bacterium]
MKTSLKTVSLMLVLLVIVVLSHVQSAFAKNDRFKSGIVVGEKEIQCPHCKKTFTKSSVVKDPQAGLFSSSKGDTKTTKGCEGIGDITTEYDGSRWGFKNDLKAANDFYEIKSGGKKGGESVRIYQEVYNRDFTHRVDQKNGAIIKGGR